MLVICRLGRKVLFLEGGAQMFAAEVATGVVVALTFHNSTFLTLPLMLRVTLGAHPHTW